MGMYLIAAKMLCAYYDKDCDSRTLFEDLDITWFISTWKSR